MATAASATELGGSAQWGSLDEKAREPQRRHKVPATTVQCVKILQIAPALHGAKMQTSDGTFPVVVWALVENDDGSDDVIGLAVGGRGYRTLVGPDPDTFESYSQTG
jgi:hypothetical protein